MNQKRRNAKIRDEIERAQICYYELADAIGVSESAVYRWMRHDLRPDHEALIRAGIQKIMEVREW